MAPKESHTLINLFLRVFPPVKNIKNTFLCLGTYYNKKNKKNL
jgi:hypothetical protein